MRILVFLMLVLAGSPVFAANCFISEYGLLGISSDGNEVPVADVPITTQLVSYNTSTQSSAFNSSTRYIRVICDAKAHFAIAASPTATASSPYVAPDVAEYFGVNPGLEIAFYDGTS